MRTPAVAQAGLLGESGSRFLGRSGLVPALLEQGGDLRRVGAGGIVRQGDAAIERAHGDDLDRLVLPEDVAHGEDVVVCPEAGQCQDQLFHLPLLVKG